MKIIKSFFFLIILLLLTACGGGGDGPGASSGEAVGSGTVSYCSDTGTAFQGYEYYNGGGDLNQNEGNNCRIRSEGVCNQVVAERCIVIMALRTGQIILIYSRIMIGNHGTISYLA